ncbi:unnamed protein product, partial [Arabidopsis halleri]
MKGCSRKLFDQLYARIRRQVVEKLRVNKAMYIVHVEDDYDQ